MTREEMMRLQGMNPISFNLVVSLSQLGQQIGNSMSLNVLERLFVRLLPAADLSEKLVDR
jgi:site-specific DNA-cytosine methylase